MLPWLEEYSPWQGPTPGTPEFSDQIQCLKPSKEGAEDIVIWLPTKEGIYTTKSGYNSKALSDQLHAPQTTPNLWELNFEEEE